MSKLNKMPGHLLQADLEDLRERGDRAYNRLRRRARSYERFQAFRSWIEKLF